jgi:hypothetical protein
MAMQLELMCSKVRFKVLNEKINFEFSDLFTTIK